MATAPLPTPSDIKNAPTVIKIPNTLIMDKDGNMAREWIYFFNDIGRAVDQQITANLPELTQKLIDTVAETLQLGSDADAIRADIIIIKGDVTDNKTAIATNTTNITANTSGLATANGKISTNTSNIATANTEISNQAGLISGLTTRLDTKDTEVSALQSATATHTSDIAANTSNIQAHSTTLTDLEARVAALEAAP